MVVEMLNAQGIEAKLEIAVDNNSIDRMVREYRPTHVIIEAFWVVPEKFEILHKLHPHVQWIIRNHSEMPFLATEGSATGWMLEYIKHSHVSVSSNSPDSFWDFRRMVAAAYGDEVAERKVKYLPNFYLRQDEFFNPTTCGNETLKVGCFCAIRPLKNQFIQAIAAVDFASRNAMKLEFHMNSARIEGHGSPVLKSIRSLFEHLDPERFQLIEHNWLDHTDFLKLVATMDIGLQVSFTETFNIVTADFVCCGKPIVISPEIFWMPRNGMADPTSVEDIQRVMQDLLYGGEFDPEDNLRALSEYNYESIKYWTAQF